MRLLKCNRFVKWPFLIVLFCNLCSYSFAQDKNKRWSGKLKDGTVIYMEDLREIFLEHEKWSKNPKEGRRAELEKANLSQADFSGVNLNDAEFNSANLEEAVFFKTNLQRVNFIGANIRGAAFVGADLAGAKLHNANLQKVMFKKVNLARAALIKTNLQGAKILSTNLRSAIIKSADLRFVDFSSSNLIDADLQSSNLNGAKLQNTNIDGTNFQNSDLKDTTYETKPNNLPDITSIALAMNLASIKYTRLPHALVELREAFKKYGLRKQEREITYAIKHSGFENALENGNFITKAEVILGNIFFEQTCKWGMASERPLFIMLGLIAFFTLPYAQAISQNICGKKKTDGLWKVWMPERVRDDLGKTKPKELLDSISPGFCFKMGFYFSILSAFNIGWRELNVGNWINRIQPHEYRLQATGWARCVSGIQSIISVYLLALSVLTYFGRPFEGY